MAIEPILLQLFGACLTVIGGLILSRIQQQTKLQQENNESLKRLEILFEVKTAGYDERLKDHDSKIAFLQTKLTGRR